ncbi:LuxR C-terminal-related transcriptional regulator [Arthrobacter sp. StoSoilB5]|uniref:LuxR C-terminal-related transcriptional regulator n=1 Tax=Arthrobacter sp. StoSoilB5 TaxID=2830992 RepID=UPI001CC82E69|nr:LuxR C-terminal-related transcriptional regulator [Arthrobacter sp. StoSoilB5]BCW47065.1 hypothetical protein StoSoilB5_42490 [Arthrobacter sp. StoSoilB5]
MAEPQEPRVQAADLCRRQPAPSDLAFSQTIATVLAYIERNVSVRIVGQPGSGRTTVAHHAASALKKSGARAHVIGAVAPHGGRPHSSPLHFGLDPQHGLRSDLTSAASVLETSCNQVLIVDDIGHLDGQSMAFLQATRQKYGCLLIATALEGERVSGGQSALFDIGTEAIVQIAPMQFEQVHAFLEQMLGAAPANETTTRILAMSGGYPKVAMRVADTARLSGLLVLRRGQWHIAGDSLWNQHLRGTVEGLLKDLEPEEYSGLRTAAIIGNVPMDVLETVVDNHILDELERRGFLRTVDGHSVNPQAAISPQVIVDFFRRDATLREIRALRGSIAPLAHPSQTSSLPTGDPGQNVATPVTENSQGRTFGTLTERETRIASMAGLQTNIEIAEQLGISPRTVQNHIYNAFRKTGMESRRALYVLVANDGGAHRAKG